MNTNNSKLYKSTNAKDPGRYFNELSERINNDLAGAVKEDFPPNLYDPVRYVLESRGKRFRPVVLLMAAGFQPPVVDRRGTHDGPAVLSCGIR